MKTKRQWECGSCGETFEVEGDLLKSGALFVEEGVTCPECGAEHDSYFNGDDEDEDQKQ